MKDLRPLTSAPGGRCAQWGCENAALVWLRVGQSQQTFNGFLIAKVAGWYCPVCAGSYGGYETQNEKLTPLPLAGQVERRKDNRI